MERDLLVNVGGNRRHNRKFGLHLCAYAPLLVFSRPGWEVLFVAGRPGSCVCSG